MNVQTAATHLRTSMVILATAAIMFGTIGAAQATPSTASIEAYVGALLDSVSDGATGDLPVAPPQPTPPQPKPPKAPKGK